MSRPKNNNKPPTDKKKATTLAEPQPTDANITTTNPVANKVVSQELATIQPGNIISPYILEQPRIFSFPENNLEEILEDIKRNLTNTQLQESDIPPTQNGDTQYKNCIKGNPKTVANIIAEIIRKQNPNIGTLNEFQRKFGGKKETIAKNMQLVRLLLEGLADYSNGYFLIKHDEVSEAEVPRSILSSQETLSRFIKSQSEKFMSEVMESVGKAMKSFEEKFIEAAFLHSTTIAKVLAEEKENLQDRLSSSLNIIDQLEETDTQPTTTEFNSKINSLESKVDMLLKMLEKQETKQEEPNTLTKKTKTKPQELKPESLELKTESLELKTESLELKPADDNELNEFLKKHPKFDGNSNEIHVLREANSGKIKKFLENKTTKVTYTTPQITPEILTNPLRPATKSEIARFMDEYPDFSGNTNELYVDQRNGEFFEDYI